MKDPVLLDFLFVPPLRVDGHRVQLALLGEPSLKIECDVLGLYVESALAEDVTKCAGNLRAR